MLQKYNQIWQRVKKFLQIEFENKPIYGDDDKYPKTKLKIYAGSMIINFQSKRLPKEKAPWKCLSIIIIDSVIKAKKNYYPQTLLKECKFEEQKIKMENLLMMI